MCPESRAPSLTCKRQSVTGGMGGSHKVTRETELVAELLSGKVSGLGAALSGSRSSGDSGEALHEADPASGPGGSLGVTFMHTILTSFQNGSRF